MGMLLPTGAILIVIGTSGSAAACYNSSSIFHEGSMTLASQMTGQTDALANASNASSPRLILAPLAGLALAVGLLCVGIGVGNWNQPIPSEKRRANPWSDQPREHGDPPIGQV